MAEYYTDRKLPGVGMSIGLTRLFDLMKAANLIPAGRATTADVLVLPMGDVSAYALDVTRQLRDAGIPTEIYLGEVKFKNKMTYANKIGVPYVVVLGEDEAAAGQITLKNMQTGVQETLSLQDVVLKLQTAGQDAPCV